MTSDAMPQVEIPDEADRRFSVLSYEQVKRLSDLMSEVISIQGRGNFPTIEVKLCDLVSVVKERLEEDGVKVREIRLNGSGASSVLAADFAADISYNDLDLIFSVDLSTGKAYDRVKCAVLDSLMQLLPEGVSRKRMSSCSLKEAYVSKMVKVNDSDRWSLITLGNNRSKSVELKFVDSMRRQYEFSVDSFHILLDTLFLFYGCARMPISDNFYPTVVGESVYGDFHEAIFHLHKKLIATRSPEEIRGGGLLKYCNLLCQGYQPARPDEVKNMERYMCSRFFIDFPDLHTQQGKLENYLYNHFQSSEDRLKHEYLMILYQVVDESTVCLMGHERRLTLSLIEDLAYQIYCPPPESDANFCYSEQQHLEHVSSASSTNGDAESANGTSSSSSMMSPMSDTSSTISSIDSSSSSSSSSASSSGYATPVSSKTVDNAATHGPATTPANLIPTYEIVTSCQPAVVYSNGYYYTSFIQNNGVSVSSGGSTTVSATMSTANGPCLACSCSQWKVAPATLAAVTANANANNSTFIEVSVSNSTSSS